jgi:hypothetical protein
MADVRLDFYDLDDDALPDVCMKCGAPPTVRPIKTFTWVPYWARMIPFGVAFMKRRRVPIPLCDRHKNHWTVRYVIAFGGLGLFGLVFIAGVAMLASDDGAGGPVAVLGGLTMALAGFLFLAWIVAAIVLGATTISAFEITDDSIFLKNVSPEFKQAYREMTRGGFAPDVDDVFREQFGRPGGRRPPESDDPRRPRPDDYPPDDKYRRG